MFAHDVTKLLWECRHWKRIISDTHLRQARLLKNHQNNLLVQIILKKMKTKIISQTCLGFPCKGLYPSCRVNKWYT